MISFKNSSKSSDSCLSYTLAAAFFDWRLGLDLPSLPCLFRRLFTVVILVILIVLDPRREAP
jgi:hypothetical protein